jgi:ABC-type phosphate transport system substrate-binding protein
MIKIKKTLMVLFFSTLTSLVSAETAVVVAASNGNATMDKSTISKIFLGKSKSFPDGSQAIPIDQKDGSPVRGAFNSSVLGKSASQLKSYWSRLIFTGKGTPPKQSDSDADVKSLVSNNPNMIGYIDAASVDASVKVIHKF